MGEDIRGIIAGFPDKKSALLPILHKFQKERGYLSTGTMVEVAELLELSPAEVLEVVSFYTLFQQEKIGTYLIQVCRTLSCYLCGAFDLLGYLEKKLDIQAGQTTNDGRFTLEAVECIAYCHKAPAVQINFDYYGDLTPEKMDQILEGLP